MSDKNRYYVHKMDGKVTRLALIGTVNGDFGAYGYVGGAWQLMPGLFKIENDITDYEDITEAQAKEIMEQLDHEK